MGTRDRRPYLTATTLNQALLDQCQDNLDFGMEMVVEVSTPTGIIYASDRNKYVGSRFYRAMTKFPVIKRTVGDWLSPEVEFSTLTLQLSNVDGALNEFLPEGGNFGGWIDQQINVMVGLREEASTYTTIFRGYVTEVAGFQRDIGSITLIARDQFDQLNMEFPTQALDSTTYPYLSPDLVGTALPVIYGDWTVSTNNNRASVPAIVTNSAKPGVDPEKTALEEGTEKIAFVVSGHALASLDSSNIWLRRGSKFYPMDPADFEAVGVENREFLLRQSATVPAGVTLVEGAAYTWESGDEFHVRCKGKDLGADSDNVVAQAKDILKTYGGLLDGDFDANWGTFAAKTTPAQDAIATTKGRVWVQEPQKVMAFAASLLEQVRLEPFISRDLVIKLNSTHFSDFVAGASFSVRNWDLQRQTFKPALDERNQWNRAQGDYSFDPLANQNQRSTLIYKNPAAVAQAHKEISKKVVFPNLYIESQVETHLKEMIKLASGYAELCEMNLTPRALLLDIGDFVRLNVKIGSTIFSDAPAMVREIGYDPSGKVFLKAWSFQMMPFPGWAPGYAGIVGGHNASITV